MAAEKACRIFLAKEFGVHVWALDLWIKPTENYGRICQAGVDGLVYPMHGDARSLPFAEAYFDAVLCTDAYIYFGTDDLYLDTRQRFIKPGGQIGITVPGFMREIEGRSQSTSPFWAQEC
jgi:ubiquinone/menaquinone biosynthesis C-methylase UbiE